MRDEGRTADDGRTSGATAIPPHPRFDVFLSYASQDRALVEIVARRLTEAGVKPFFDRWALTPGLRWQAELAEALRASSAYGVFVGPAGLGDWAREELAVAQDRAAHDPRFRLFMVLLDGAPRIDDPALAFLGTRTWVDLRAGVADADAFDELLAAVSGVPSRRGPAERAPSSAPCPYRGLAPFEEDDADVFFGREDDIRRLLERLRDSRFLAVLGPSGSGKSSLVRAGLIPALRRGALPASDRWIVRTLTPGGRPLDTIAAELVEVFERERMSRTVDELADDERTLDLEVTLGLGATSRDTRLLLVIDQFEEVFTQCSDERQREAFLSNLLYAATIPGGRTVLVIGMRADFYHRCAAYPQLRSPIATQQFLVGPMDADSLRRAIEEPAWRSGLMLERGLVETLLGAVEGQPGRLPLLQYLLLELWGRRRNGTLTLEAYAASGGVTGALAQRADELYESFSAPRRDTARRMLLRLIQPGQGTEDTRRRVEVSELATGADAPDDVEAVIGALVDGRLLTSGRDSATGDRLVEITHEALLDGWPLLRGWIDGDRERLLAERRLDEAANEWDASGREDELLFRGARLAAWADADVDLLSPLERAFLTAARTRVARERASRRRLVRSAFALLAVVTAVISAAAVVAVRESRHATSERDIARSRELAMAATVDLAAHPRNSLRLALRAYETADTAEAEAVLRQATLDYRAIGGVHAHRGRAFAVAVGTDGRYVASAGLDGVRLWDRRRAGRPKELDRRPTYAVAISRDGRYLVAAGKDRAIRAWQLPGGRPRVLGRAPAPVLAVACGAGGVLATADARGDILMWSLHRRGARRLADLGRAAYSVAFGPDGQLLAAGGAGGRVALWRSGTDDAPHAFSAGPDDVYAVALSPDGRSLAAATAHGKVTVWPIRADRPRLVLQGDRDGVYGLVFISAGRLAGGQQNGRIRIWDREGHLIATLSGPDGRTAGVASGPKGRYLVSTGEDGTVWVWQPPSTRVLDAGGHPIYAVAASPDGRRIAAVGADGAVRVLSFFGATGPVVVDRASKELDSVAFDPRGRRLLATGLDGVVRLVDPGRRRSTILMRSKRAVFSAVFARDGRHVVTAGADGTVRFIDIATRDATVVLDHNDDATSVAVSPDGLSIVSVGNDDTVRAARVRAPHDAHVLGRYRHNLLSVDIAPDGRELVMAAVDGTVWVGTPTRPFVKVLRGHEGVVWRAVFSPRGDRVVTAGDDGTVRVWNPSTGGGLILRGATASTSAVAITHNGRYVVAGADDGLVRIWPCEVCGAIANVVALARTRWLS